MKNVDIYVRINAQIPDSFEGDVQDLFLSLSLKDVQIMCNDKNAVARTVNGVELTEYETTQIEELDSEEVECQRCGSPLEDGLCSDETCPFAEYHQDDQRGWAGHPNPPSG